MGHFCFQPTYEELKLVIMFNPPVSSYFQFSAYLWGIETGEREGEECSFLGFQPTYEELKPVDDDDAWNVSSVFSLPMRNWNQRNKMMTCVRSWFSAYLWGIETSIDMLPVCSTLSTFSAYLWGIETVQLPVSAGFRHSRFQPTYEELKLPLNLAHCPPG